MKYYYKYTIILCLILFLPCCRDNQQFRRNNTNETIVFKHGKIAGDPALFKRLLDEFEKEHPGTGFDNV
jgi:hypothetical protein